MFYHFIDNEVCVLGGTEVCGGVWVVDTGMCGYPAPSEVPAGGRGSQS